MTEVFSRYEIIFDLGFRDGARWQLGRSPGGKHVLLRCWPEIVPVNLGAQEGALPDVFTVPPAVWGLCDQDNVDLWFDLGFCGRSMGICSTGRSVTDVATLLAGGTNPLREQDVLHVADGVCQALTGLAAEQDEATSLLLPQVNPRNVRLRLDGYAVLAGAELCYFRDPALRCIDEMMLTPEELDGAAPDMLSEIYRLGRIVVALLLGRDLLLAGDKSAALLALHRMDPALAEVCERALDADPKARWGTAEAFRHALAATRASRVETGHSQGLSRALADALGLSDTERASILPTVSDSLFYDWRQYPDRVPEPENWRTNPSADTEPPAPLLLLDGLAPLRHPE